MSEVMMALAGNTNASYSNATKERKRSIAVAAALELITARVSTAAPNGAHLEAEVKNISMYADQIQAALEAK
ncbi:hypothetical protein QAO71_10505 [Halopseudomonas sp. SMJS2]|uniref:hypothetical protein n=1 Tax=Halopseudomonas sp. SMJS2 TaxID=3041098 RepID=UPI00245292A8|nr:hypothetical protein [Halopseudomonas sp. SMJS2]WGK60524.1 hypothetical protein QAO71_10505 [Halopseudomonas sp. SMJS2]